MRNLMPDNPFEIISEPISDDASLGVKRVLKYQGQDCFLAGIYPNLIPGANVENEMQKLEDNRNNFFRHWMIVYWEYRTIEGRRNSPFKFANGQWDLAAYNNGYFTGLKEMLDSARRHGVIVQIMLFDKSGMIPDRPATETRPADPRWTNNPWNASTTPSHPTPNNINGVINKDDSGLPDFFTKATPGSLLATLQNNYVRKVVRETREFPNVVYEIMNEPVNLSDHTLAVWANTILGVIAPLIQGRRLVFYNAHNGFGTPLAQRGTDVKDWKANAATLTNYDRLDGVILHGDPNKYNPERFNNLGWNWAHDKLLQGSSDAFDEELRSTGPWNKQTATVLFSRKQVFQAEASSQAALLGIGGASPKPTIIKLPSFLGCWHKTSTGGKLFDLRFDGKSRFVGFDPESDQILVQGNLESFEANTFTVHRDGQPAAETYTYSLSADRRTLTYTRNNQTQEFERMPFDFEPFLFGWEKFSESVPSEFSVYLLYFGKSGSDMVFTKRNSTDPTILFDQGKVLEIKTATQLPTIKMFSQPLNSSSTYRYDFYYDPQRRPCLMLKDAANQSREDFRRITGY